MTVKAIESISTRKSPVLNILKTRNSLKARKADKPPPSFPSDRAISIREIITTSASNILNLSLENYLIPKPINFIMTSKVKTIVKIMFMINRIS